MDYAERTDVAFERFEKLLTEQKPLIDGVIAFIARRHRLDASEAEEFASFVYLELIENDYEIFRKFREQSSLKAYLTVVINNLCRHGPSL